MSSLPQASSRLGHHSRRFSTQPIHILSPDEWMTMRNIEGFQKQYGHSYQSYVLVTFQKKGCQLNTVNILNLKSNSDIYRYIKSNC